MAITRREALNSFLFGAGMIGLRALATGLPASFLMNPRKALADMPMCGDQSKAQFVIFSTSGGGDPMGTNAPGTYGDPNLLHPADPQMAPASLMIRGQSYMAAAPWATLPQPVLDNTCFWHLMTNTPVHPQEPSVLKLMGAIQPAEMFPSLLAKMLAPCLGTIQAQPVTVGAQSPSEGLSFDGAALPIIPPTALQATLLAPNGPLKTLQPLRDQTLGSLYDLYKNGASPAQRTYIDSLVTSTQQLRSINQDLLSSLSTISDNGINSQITAALTLIRMKVTPVIAIHIPFGGDNHTDPGLALETAQTVSGVAAIGQLMSQLQTLQLDDKVTFATLNVFGRTMSRNNPTNVKGRGHNPNHQMSLTISNAIKGGVIGGVAPAMGDDYGATNIDSGTGASNPGGDIAAVDTLPSFGKTLLASMGVDSTLINKQIPTGKIIQSALV